MSGARATSHAYEVLGRVPVFARLGTRSLRKLVRLCVERTYDAGAEIITEGSTGLGLYVITSGEVEVFKGSGDDRVVLARLERGAVLGELALIDARPRSASAVALTDTTCLLITRSGFQDLVRREPDIAWCFVPVLAGRVRDLQARVMASAAHPDDGVLDGGTGVDGARLPPASTSSSDEPREAGENDGDLDRHRNRQLVDEAIHAQHALARAGLTALDGGVRALGAMIDTLYDETMDRPGSEPDDPQRDADATGALRRLPKGMTRAVGEAFRQAEQIPERMITTLRHHLRRGPRRRGDHD
jgi:CRP-like cAMP-binding protein